MNRAEPRDWRMKGARPWICSDAGSDMQTYSEYLAGAESSPATDDPDSDGSLGGSAGEMQGEESGNTSDGRPSPLSDQPDDNDSVPHSPATPIASRPSDVQEDETAPVIPEKDKDKAPNESGSKVTELGRKRGLSSTTEASPPKEGSSTPRESRESQDRSQRARKTRRIGDEIVPNPHQTRSVGAGKGVLKKQ